MHNYFLYIIDFRYAKLTVVMIIFYLERTCPHIFFCFCLQAEYAHPQFQLSNESTQPFHTAPIPPQLIQPLFLKMNKLLALNSCKYPHTNAQ